MLFVFVLLAVVVAATVHALVGSRPNAAGRSVVELFMVYLLAGYYGFAMLLAAFIHLTRPEAIADLKGWPVSRPVQTLYAFALFGLAASSILTIWFRGSYLLAPAISGSLLLLGGAYVHGSEIIAARRFVPAEDGPEVLLDFVVPTVVLALTALHQCHTRTR